MPREITGNDGEKVEGGNGVARSIPTIRCINEGSW